MSALANQCNAIAKSTGVRCERNALEDSTFCYQHRGQKPAPAPTVHSGAGAPLGLDERLISQFDSVIRAGNYIQTAIAYLSVSESTFYRWMKRGEELRETGATNQSDALKLRLWEVVTRARAAAEVGAVTRLAAIARDENTDARVRVQTDQWFLERSFRNRWGSKRVEVDLSGSVELELNLPAPRVLTAEIVEAEYEGITHKEDE